MHGQVYSVKNEDAGKFTGTFTFCSQPFKFNLHISNAGNLFENIDGKLEFNGAAEESAIIFFDNLVQHHSSVVQKLRDQIIALGQTPAA